MQACSSGCRDRQILLNGQEPFEYQSADDAAADDHRFKQPLLAAARVRSSGRVRASKEINP
jgi:hypothetical protein